jgi:hypothetical protein
MAGHSVGKQICRIGAQIAHVTKYAATNIETYDANSEKYFESNQPVHINRVMRACLNHNTDEEIVEECENWINRDEKDEQEWQTCCPERPVQPVYKKSPRVELTKRIPLSRKEKDIQNISLVQQPRQVNKLQTKQESQQQTNHNDCFVEAHNKILEEQHAANDSITRMREEQITMAKQLNRMITIETISEL